jgi:RNA polymerase sigma-70 factor (ECF subfamily)
VPSVAHESSPASAQARLDDLYRTYGDETYGLAYSLLGSRHEAEDATQEAFLNAGRSLAHGTKPVEPRAWLLAIVRNVCRRRFRERAQRSIEVPLDAELRAQPTSEGPRAAEIQTALAHLPPAQRDVLLLRELEGRSLAEISRRLSLSETAVSALLFRARAAVREELEADKNPVPCDDVPRLVVLHRRGEAEPSERRQLRAHLRACATCATVARRLRAVRPLFGLVPELVLRAIAWIGRAGAAAKVGAATGAAALGMGIAVELSSPPAQPVDGDARTPPAAAFAPLPLGSSVPHVRHRVAPTTDPAPASRTALVPARADRAQVAASPAAAEPPSAAVPAKSADAGSAAASSSAPPPVEASGDPAGSPELPVASELARLPEVPTLPSLPEPPPLPELPLPELPSLPELPALPDPPPVDAAVTVPLPAVPLPPPDELLP